MNPIILTDIEGTTSSISFVKDVLFPYARQALPGFVRARGDEPEVRQWLDQVAMENGGVCQDAMIVETLQGWIDQDRKHTALKALQGMVWEAGYRSGDFRSEEHTSELQSLMRTSYAVFCLKKKTEHSTHTHHSHSQLDHRVYIEQQ